MNTHNKKQPLLIPVIACLIASFFYVYDYILRVMPEAMADFLMRDLHIHAGGLGVLASLFFWGYAPMQIPAGMLFDHFSVRKILTVATFFSALAALGFATTHHVSLASFYRFVMGFMTSGAFVGALVVGATWFRGQHFAMYSGLVQLLGCLGAIIGVLPVTKLSSAIGWRHTSLWIAVFGFLLALLIWLVLKDPPQHQTLSSEIKVYAFKTYRKVFFHAQTWWIALYGFAIWAPMTVLAETWGVNYLQNGHNLSKVSAAHHITIIWWTVAIGGPLVGWLSKHLKTRRWPMWTCALIGTVSAFSLLFISPGESYALVFSLVGYGLGSAGGLVMAFGLIVDIQPRKAVGAVIGFTNMAVILSGVVLLPTVGFIIQHLWDGTIINGVPIYSEHSYQMALLMLPLSFGLAFLTTFLVKETHCEKLHEY